MCNLAAEIVGRTCLGRIGIVVSSVPCIMEGLEFEDLAAVGSPCGKSGVYLNVGLVMPLKLLTTNKNLKEFYNRTYSQMDAGIPSWLTAISGSSSICFLDGWMWLLLFVLWTFLCVK